MAYGYDADGNRTSLTYPSGVAVTYGYTNRNKVSSISVGGSSLATYVYDGNSNIVSKNLSDGTLASYTYDAANRLMTLNHTLSGTSFARFDYGYDSVNRRTYEKRDSAAGDVFGYDAVDQVTGVNYDATNPTSGSSGADRTVGYTYDATGNRTAVNDSVNGNARYTANNLNQYSNVGGAAYSYDGNGNLFYGNGFYFYDAQNRLIFGEVGSNYDEFGYDSKNRVAIRVVNGTLTYLIYDGWDLIEERNAAGTVLATYVHGVRQDEMLTRTTSSGTVYYHHNGLGSVTDLTNASGVVVEKYKYDAFGKPSISDGSGNPLTASAYGNRFLFTGREYLSEISLYDYRNRVYSADLGRFLQADPMSFSAGDVNIYRYCANNPTNNADPMGLCPDKPSLTQAQLEALAVQYLENEGYPSWLANAMVGAGTFAINNSTALETANNVLMAAQMLDGAGELEAAAEELPALAEETMEAANATTGAVNTWWGGAEGLEAAQASGGTILTLSPEAQAAATAGDYSLVVQESQAAAQAASGAQQAFLGSTGGSIFMGTELPALLANPAVTTIEITF